jgi:hypothetical protein
MPYGYGGIVATRPLSLPEQQAFLEFARREARTSIVTARAVEGLGGRLLGRDKAMTSVAVLAEPPENQFAKKARQSIRRSLRAGATVTRSEDGARFLDLYEDASINWAMQYPSSLVTRLGWLGAARFYNVAIEGHVRSSIVALLGPSHWMYWLAAQDEVGRSHELGYLAVSEMLQDAYREGVGAVNLGASQGLPGVMAFKARLGGVPRPMIFTRCLSARGRLRAVAGEARAFAAKRAQGTRR